MSVIVKISASCEDRKWIVKEIQFLLEEKIYLCVGSNAIFEMIDFLFQQKEKKISVFVADLSEVGFVILRALNKDKKFQYKFFLIDLNLYSISVLFEGRTLMFFCLEKLWPNYRDAILIFYEKELLDKLILIKGVRCLPQSPNLSDIQKKINLNESVSNDFIELLITEKAFILLETFYKKYKINFWKNQIFSFSGFAYKCFLKNFNTYGISPELADNLDAHIRESYFGGRCEVFGNPEEDDEIHYYDFIGMYSQCMREQFPIKKGFFSFNVLDFSKPGFYDITFESKMNIPVLPFKKKIDSKLMFCNGVMRGTYWYEEILLFLDEGGSILNIHSGYIFEEQGFVFKNYVDEFSQYKKTNNVYKNFSKLYINSFYGRLGMQQKNVSSTVFFDELDFQNFLKNPDVRKFAQIGDCWVVEFDKTSAIKNKNSMGADFLKKNNVIYASVITSKARIKLYKAFKNVMAEGGRLLYCDTDSIFAAFKKKTLPILSDTFYETNLINDALFISPRQYFLNCKDGGVGKVISHRVDRDFYKIKEEFYKEHDRNCDYKKNDYSNHSFLKINQTKRIFLKNKKSTQPYIYIEGVYC